MNCMHVLKKIIPQWIKNIYHLKMAILANFWHGFPSRKIKVIGVTGTNGKTTTCQMIARILEEAGYKVAMITTINFKLAEKEWVNTTKFTTLSSFKVQEFIKDAVQAGCEYLVLETSSHALDQFRVWGINYQTAVITNLTREHLDYHRTMAKYREAKLKLFKKAKIAVVNLDMEKPEEFLRFKNKNKFLYSCQAKQSTGRGKVERSREDQLDSSAALGMTLVKAENIELGANYSTYKVQNTAFKIHLPGLFNIENALAAACVGLSEGIGLEKMSQALAKIQGVPGRMEYVPNTKGVNIIIDYAVTPDSLEKLYQLILRIKSLGSPTSKSKIIAVFGACGERDRGKRPIMGAIVSRCADHIILTNEDPYHEDPEQIISELEAGIKNHELEKNFWKIMDRRAAIRKALRLAKPGDFVVVTGKGAEETMAMGEKRIPWNDKRAILEEIEKMP